MKCDEIRERMPDVAAGFTQLATEDSNHLASCGTCAGKLKEMRATMALLDEWYGEMMRTATHPQDPM